jgi:hypothetical protein
VAWPEARQQISITDKRIEWDKVKVPTLTSKSTTLGWATHQSLFVGVEYRFNRRQNANRFEETLSGMAQVKPDAVGDSGERTKAVVIPRTETCYR